MCRRSITNRDLLLALVLLTSVAGCGESLHPVRGTVTFEDSSPVPKALIIFESVDRPPAESLTGRAEVQADGAYQVSTNAPGDGLPAGKYRVLLASTEVMINVDAPPPRLPFDKRFTDFSTSGLEFEVKPGANEFPIRVTRSGRTP